MDGLRNEDTKARLDHVEMKSKITHETNIARNLLLSAKEGSLNFKVSCHSSPDVDSTESTPCIS